MKEQETMKELSKELNRTIIKFAGDNDMSPADVIVSMVAILVALTVDTANDGREEYAVLSMMGLVGDAASEYLNNMLEAQDDAADIVKH
jgi:hypothetical protein